MFVNILEDGGKISRISGKLTTRTRSVKLPVGEIILPQLNSCDFKSLLLRLINRHRKANLQG